MLDHVSSSRLCRALYLLPLCTLLSACSAMLPNRLSAELLDPKLLESPMTGTVILSVGAPEPCKITSTFGHLIDMDAAREVSIFPIDNHFTKSDFPDHQGSVDVLVLNPGRYIIRPMLAGPYNHSSQAPEYGFAVIAGETTYIGELFMPISCVMSGKFEIRDQYARDMAVSGGQNSAITNRTVVKRLMTLQGVWDASSGK